MSIEPVGQTKSYSLQTSPFFTEVRRVLRLRHMSPRTEDSYLYYILDCIRFHGKRHPRELGVDEIWAYLSHLAVEGKVAASTHNVALSALLFLYRQVLHIDLPDIDHIERARRPKRLPVVFTQDEVRAILVQLTVGGSITSSSALLYGTGMRLSECLSLRVKDVDFAVLQITVRDGKGEKDRVTMLPRSLSEPLTKQFEHAQRLHQYDLAEGFGQVELPDALTRKYPNAAKSWGWQYVFPAAQRSVDPRSGRMGRHHILEDSIQRSMKKAIQKAGITKR
jgi:integron integrase